MWRPSRTSLLLWAAQIQDRDRRKKVSRMPVPCTWTRPRTPGSVEGSSRKVVKASGLASRAVWTGWRRWGRVERLLPQY